MKISSIHVETFRVPITRPVATSFGIMHDRPAVFVKLIFEDGCFGWGEIFANWPAAGAEHRARLLMMDVADVLFELDEDRPENFRKALERRTRIRAVQCGEIGPFDQAIAGIDTAIHDMFARKAGLPLAQYLNNEARSSVPIYASGIAARAAETEVEKARSQGIRNFKIKVGFNAQTDIETLRTIAADLSENERVFADANQAWNVENAIGFMQEADELNLGWIEEPIPAESDLAEWLTLSGKIKTPIAVGENIVGEKAFGKAINSGSFAVIQPDVAKWGGVSGCYSMARDTLDAGLRYCPHFLGGGIGLIASAHLLAAAGGDGLLEVDLNPNPLRDAFLEDELSGGQWKIPDKPGLGIEALPEEIAEFRTLSLSETRD